MDLGAKKRQDHFSPDAASCINNAVSHYGILMECPSEVQVPQSLSHLILMAVPGGTLMTIIPNLQMKKMELIERLRNLPWLFFRSLVVKGLNPWPQTHALNTACVLPTVFFTQQCVYNAFHNVSFFVCHLFSW